MSSKKTDLVMDTEDKVFLVDTDPGVDDCAALMMMLSQVPKLKIVGLTCVAGNVDLHQVTVNAVRIVKLFDMLDEIPIFKGCGQPMVSMPTLPNAEYYHGKDGLGDVPNVHPICEEGLLENVQELHGVNAIINLSKQYAKKLQVICLGPLTNVALAAKLDPGLPSRLKSLHILGGTLKGYGNATPCAEYNFLGDPEAAYNVLRNFPQHCQTDILPIEVASEHGVPGDLFNRMLSGNGARASFFREVFEFTKTYMTKPSATGISDTYSLCDTFLAAIVLSSKAVKKAKKARVGIELSGCIARGSLIIDHESQGSSHLSEADVRIIEDVDDDIYRQLLDFAFHDQ